MKVGPFQEYEHTYVKFYIDVITKLPERGFRPSELNLQYVRL